MTNAHNRSNQTKANFLGEPYGTACAKLKKAIMFNLLCKLGENICFRCSNPIVKIESLSIDHKQSWLHVDKELFFNLENVAFSHLRCNKVDRISPTISIKPDAPDGYLWCNDHKAFLPVTSFHRTKMRVSGYAHCCKSCLLIRKNHPRTCRECGFYGDNDKFRSCTNICKECWNKTRRESYRVYHREDMRKRRKRVLN